ncbi:MAG: hypothetical protein EBS55_09055 [Flavobacteriaceae bacterium]|jgi:hypothetical protein|nr:hypothetical protein [Flavobacteriaceae bacterium]
MPIDRIGSQNVIRVLSNAVAPPARIVDLTDVDTTLLENGSVLVYDASTQTFVVTLSLTPTEEQNLFINGGVF